MDRAVSSCSRLRRWAERRGADGAGADAAAAPAGWVVAPPPPFVQPTARTMAATPSRASSIATGFDGLWGSVSWSSVRPPRQRRFSPIMTRDDDRCRPGTRSSTAATAGVSSGSASRVVDRPAPGAEDRPDGSPRPLALGRPPVRSRRAAGPGADRSPWTTEMDGLTLELRPIGAAARSASTRSTPRPGRGSGMRSRIAREADGAAPLRGHWGHDPRAGPTGARSPMSTRREPPSPGHVATRSSRASRTGRSAGSSTTRLAFVRREARRGRRYDLIVLDPPSYGHGADRRALGPRRALPELLDAVPPWQPTTRSSC